MSLFNFDFPNLDQEINLNHLINQTKIEQSYSRNLSRWINMNDDIIKANSFSDIVTIIKQGMQGQARQNNLNFVDLKEAFSQSPKAKTSKNGGWYLIIPIGQKASQLKSNAPRSLWNQISSMDFGETGSLSDDNTNYLEQGFDTQSNNVINPLQYQWKSANVTRVAPKTGSGRYGHYISFRTVSDKSPASSWIEGRNAFTNDNTSDQQQTDISVYIRHALDSYQKEGN